MSGREIGAELLERWALGYLGRYASSAENLRRVLTRRVRRLSPEAISPGSIRARLMAKGVPAAVVAGAVSGLRDAAPDPDLAAACAFARRRRLGPFRRAAANPARELAAFARAGFGRRVAQAVLACADEDAVAVLARDGLD